MDTAATGEPSRLARLARGVRASLRAGTRLVTRLGLDVALPRLCPSCRDLITYNVLCPACWRMLCARRLNQPGALANDTSRRSSIVVAHTALRRVKATQQQVGLSHAERTTNVQGAFRVDAAAKPKVAGRRLVLIDDVLTSGATVGACTRALLRAGAANVDVLVFARVVDGGKAPI